jgi:hypothetical protein
MTSTEHISQDLVDALLEVRAANDGKLDQYVIVDAARDPSSILHSHFEWDEANAAYRYQLEQAQTLVRRFEHTIEKKMSTGETVSVRIKTFSSNPENTGWVLTEELLSSPERSVALLSRLRDEARGLRDKIDNYRIVAEFYSPAWKAASEAIEVALDEE